MLINKISKLRHNSALKIQRFSKNIIKIKKYKYKKKIIKIQVKI